MLQACTENCQAHISLKAAPGSALAVPGSAPAFLQQLAFVHTLILFQGSFPGWTRMPQPPSADITHIAAATFNHPPNAILLNLDSGSSWRLLPLCLFDIFCFVFFSFEVSSLAYNDDARLFCFVSSSFPAWNWKELFVSFREEWHFESAFQVCGSACPLSRHLSSTGVMCVSQCACVSMCEHECAPWRLQAGRHIGTSLSSLSPGLSPAGPVTLSSASEGFISHFNKKFLCLLTLKS